MYTAIRYVYIVQYLEQSFIKNYIKRHIPKKTVHKPKLNSKKCSKNPQDRKEKTEK